MREELCAPSGYLASISASTLFFSETLMSNSINDVLFKSPLPTSSWSCFCSRISAILSDPDPLATHNSVRELGCCNMRARAVLYLLCTYPWMKIKLTRCSPRHLALSVHKNEGFIKPAYVRVYNVTGFILRVVFVCSIESNRLGSKSGHAA